MGWFQKKSFVIDLRDMFVGRFDRIDESSLGMKNIYATTGILGTTKVKLPKIKDGTWAFRGFGEYCLHEEGCYVIFPQNSVPMTHYKEYAVMLNRIQELEHQYTAMVQELLNLQNLFETTNNPEYMHNAFNNTMAHFSLAQRMMRGRKEIGTEGLALEKPEDKDEDKKKEEKQAI